MNWDIPIGTEIGGYRITSVLGSGGMSIVYAAEHTRLGRTVALKLLSPALAEDEDFRNRFDRESRLAATLDHPNIIPIYDAGEAEGYLYIAMRHVQGSDLGSLIKREGQQSLGQTLFYIEQVAGALDQAHEQGLVHRDVKPANILIALPSDRVYLTDFGVVKQTSSRGLTKTGYFLGTFEYAAPEQIEGKQVDGRTDLYALGCVLYECLSGEPPFDAQTEGSVIHAHLIEPPPRVTDKRPDLPAAINDVIATAMAKSKDDRYATCGDLTRALRQVALGGTVRTEAPAAHAAAPTVQSTPEAALAAAAEAPPSQVEAPPPTAGVPPPIAGVPPSTAGVPPPGPPEPREPRSVALSGKRMVAAGVALAVLIGGAVLGAILLSGDGGGTETTNGTSPRSSATQAIGLEGVVPNAIFKDCTTTTARSGASATATCQPTGTAGSFQPDRLEVSLYSNASTLGKAYDEVREENDIGRNFGRCDGTTWGGEGRWLHGPDKPGGRQLCFFEGNVAVIVWSHEKLGQASHLDLLGIARAGGSDHAGLFAWYRFWHHRIGKCQQADCVARLS